MVTPGKQSGPALAIMVREPIAGKVKTRLQPRLTPEQSTDLCHAFVQDVMAAALCLERWHLFLAFTPSEALEYFSRLAGTRFGVMAQGRGGLGKRMAGISGRLFKLGYGPVVIIGSDCPTVQPEYLEGALTALSRSDACLGPCPDGGYYLVGLRTRHDVLFQDIAWSTPQVLSATMDRAREARLALSLVDGCFDVDTFDDLPALAREIQRLKQMPGATVPLATEACLKRLGF
ncbi:MAG: TIGR04282 family arsenosugar biosynthesis glycosyltransferase [Chloroflexi bacterium]|nr:TIGR04282 family arsenosugar biosynthesis glycosyltransferase [Chloroflexota bacterium]